MYKRTNTNKQSIQLNFVLSLCSRNVDIAKISGAQTVADLGGGQSGARLSLDVERNYRNVCNESNFFHPPLEKNFRFLAKEANYA